MFACCSVDFRLAMNSAQPIGPLPKGGGADAAAVLFDTPNVG